MKILKYFLFLSVIIASSLVYSEDNKYIENGDKWKGEIKIFENFDNENTFPQDAILFVGSSTINRWKTALSFPDLKVINRGFGGSNIPAVMIFYDRIIKRFSPKTVVFYSGDNDIAAKHWTVDEIIENYKALALRIRSDFPNTKIIFLTIKKSPRRIEFSEQINAVNKGIMGFDLKDLIVVDINKIISDSEGNPKIEMFEADKLHLNDKAYSLISKEIYPLIK